MKKRSISFLLSIVMLLCAIAPPVAFATDETGEQRDGIIQSAITLAENIGLCVQLKITDTSADSIEIVAPNGSRVTHSLSDITSNDNIYLLYTDIPVKNLYEDVKYNVLNNNAEVIATYYTSAADYCQSYRTYSPDGVYLELISALENYAEVSKQYFEKDSSVTDVAEADFSSIPEMVTTGNIPDGISHIAASLLIESETTVRHYFNLSEGYDISSYTFFIDLDNNGKYSSDLDTLLPQKFRGDYYYVDIKGIAPNELGNVYRVGVTDGSQTYTCAYGALTYARNTYNKSDIVYVKNLAAAILEYSKAADRFSGTSMPIYSSGAKNHTSMKLTDQSVLDKIHEVPADQRILTVRIDFTYLYGSGSSYIQIPLAGNKKYRLVQCGESSYAARLASDIVSSSASPKFIKSLPNGPAKYARRLEIVLDYTTGTVRYYLNGIKFFDAAPAVSLPDWSAIGYNGQFLVFNGSNLYVNNLYIYVGNTGK